MAAKTLRSTIQLDETKDKALIEHLESCRSSQYRRAQLHVFILAALDDDEPVRLDLQALTETPENLYKIELMIPPTSPPRIRELHKQTSRNLRTVILRALIRYGFKLISENRGPKISTMFNALEHQAVEIVEQPGEQHVAEQIDQPDLQSDGRKSDTPSGDQIAERNDDPASPPRHQTSDRQGEFEEMDALDDHESESSSGQPEFDMNRLLGSFG